MPIIEPKLTVLGVHVALAADISINGNKVASALNKARRERKALPVSITVDNGSEFSSKCLDSWAVGNSVMRAFIRPGRPVENGFIESFNCRLRDEFLNVELLFSLPDAEQSKQVENRFQRCQTA